MEKFFSIGFAWDDELAIKEFLFRRYPNANTILLMSLEDLDRFLEIAREKEREDQIRQQWVSMLPYMSMQQLKFITFEDYKNQCLGRNIDMRSSDDIIAELEALHGQKLV